MTTSPRIGRKLNVTTVLEGSVRKAGNRVRIAVQLVKVADGYHLWSETYDRTLRGHLRGAGRHRAVGGARAAHHAARRSGGLEGGQGGDGSGRGRGEGPRHRPRGTPTLPAGTASPQSKQSRGRGEGHRLLQAGVGPGSGVRARLGGVGERFATQAGQGWARSSEGFARAREAVARALALEPDLAEAHAEMGWIQMYHDWDWRWCRGVVSPRAGGGPRQCRGASPAGGVLALCWAASTRRSLLRAKRWNRIRWAQPPYNNLGLALHANGRLAEAEAAFRKALELAPQRASAHALLALILLAQGRDDEALAEALREPEEWARLWAVAIIQHATDRRAESDAALLELIAKYAGTAAYQVAVVYAARGEVDLAFEWLERAYVQRDTGLSEMKPEPYFARCTPIRSGKDCCARWDSQTEAHVLLLRVEGRAISFAIDSQ